MDTSMLQNKQWLAADHYGILTADDIDDVVDTASKLKQVFPGKIVKLKVIEMQ